MSIISLVASSLCLSCIIATGNAQAVKDPKYLWKGGIIPYEISSGYSKLIRFNEFEIPIEKT